MPKKHSIKSQKAKSLKSKIHKNLKSHTGTTQKLILISFKDLDQNQGGNLKEWENNGNLSEAIETIKGYCTMTLTAGLQGRFTIYKDFPPKSEYTHPPHVPEDAKWAAMHVNGEVVLGGHLVDNVFYVVFLDTNHKFWITKKKHT